MWFKTCFISNWLLVLHQPEDPGAWSHLVQCFAARNSDKVWGTTHWKTAGGAADSSRKAKASDAEEKQRVWLPDSSGEDGAAPAGSSGKKKEHTHVVSILPFCVRTQSRQALGHEGAWHLFEFSYFFSVHTSTCDTSLCKIVLVYFEF